MTREIPKKLEPYLSLGVDLQWKDGDEQAFAECPFCDKHKFSVKINTGQFRCWACNTGNQKGGGNTEGFLEEIIKQGRKLQKNYSAITETRNFKDEKTPMAWDIFQSPFTNDWLVPGYNKKGKVSQLCRYKNRKLMPLKGLSNPLFGMPNYRKNKPHVYLCEGVWDAIALWEVLTTTKELEDGYTTTANEKESMASYSSVLAVPGCNTYKPDWNSLFAGKTVYLMYDNDHPKKNEKTGDILPPAGNHFMRRVAGMMTASLAPPEDIQYLRWGKKGYDSELPSGTDVRNILHSGDPLEKLAVLLGKLEPIPKSWEENSSVATGKESQLELKKCEDYKTLLNAWKKAMKWTGKMDKTLSVMLACVTSTHTLGDQLWIKVLGPPSCGKTSLCEALSISQRYIYATSSIKGFCSGYQTDKDGKEDHSLIAKAKSKTLIVKDGDTLLQAPNKEQILSEARDLYDTTSRPSYRNKTSRVYQGIRMTWILCGTSALRSLDSSELGARFLDCVVMEGIDDEFEDDVMWRVANRAAKSVKIETNGQASKQQEEKMTEAMQLSGGYVDYLRFNAVDLLKDVENPEWALKLCTRLAKLISCMRARPSYHQSEIAEREFGARLVSQLVRLANCLAAVLNKIEVDKEVMGIVTEIAFDTCQGIVLEMTKDLFHSENGCTSQGIKTRLGFSESKIKSFLSFMRKIDVVKRIETKKGRVKRIRWELSDTMEAVYKEAIRYKNAQN